MPIVTIQVTREGTVPGRASVSAEEKAALIKGVSELLLEVLKKPLEFDLRGHRGGRHGKLGLGRPARARIPAPARGGDEQSRPDDIALARMARGAGGRQFTLQRNHIRPTSWPSRAPGPRPTPLPVCHSCRN